MMDFVLNPGKLVTLGIWIVYKKKIIFTPNLS